MKKILLIEDNKEVRENTSEILELSNYTVLTADNGKTGVEIALKEKPDLIVCDIMMPVLDGYGVLHLLGKHKETSGIPFLFLTAKSEKAAFRKGMEMGADDYLTKPFDGIELLNAIEIRLKKTALLKENIVLDAGGINQFIDNAKRTTNIQLTSDEREVYSYKKKQMIYAEGQRPKNVYFVMSGKVKIYKINDEGKELIISIHIAGEFFGYTATLEGTNYTDNAQVLSDGQLMLIPNEDFLELITTDTQVAKHFIKIITQNIIEKEETLLSLAYNSLRKKVAFGLIQLIDKFKENDTELVVLTITRENMAQVTGIATESLIRTLSDFKEENLVDIEGGKIIILNEKKLRSLPY